MNDCGTQEVRNHGSRASQSFGATLTDALASVLRHTLIFPRSVMTLLARREGRHLALVPVAARHPHPVRPYFVDATRSFGG